MAKGKPQSVKRKAGGKSDGLPPKRRAASAEETLQVDLAAVQLLLDAIELGSQGRAAERHGITHGAASKQLQWLEWRLGVNLRMKSAHSLKLTKSGQALHEASLNFKRELLAIQRTNAEDQNGPNPEITIGAPQALAIHYVPYFIVEDVYGKLFSDKSKDLIIATFAANVIDCLGYIESGSTDFLICWETDLLHSSEKDDEYEKVELAMDRLVPVCGNQFADEMLEALLTAKSNRSDQKARIPLLTYSRGTMLREKVEHLVAKNHLADSIVLGHQADAAGTLKHWLKRVPGIAWLPLSNMGESRSLTRLDLALADRSESPEDVVYPLKILMMKQRERLLTGRAQTFWSAVSRAKLIYKGFQWSEVGKRE